MIRTLSAEEARASAELLAEVLLDAIGGGASGPTSVFYRVL